MSKLLNVSYCTVKNRETGKFGVLLTEEVVNTLELKLHKEGSNNVTSLEVINFLHKMVNEANS